jgi:predicted transcriptional regulator
MVKEKKTATLSIKLTKDAKEKLDKKAKALNVSTATYIFKVATEEIIFLDANMKTYLKAKE